MSQSLKIDAHQHFWKYDPLKHAWIDDSMSVLKRDFLPNNLKPVLEKSNLDGCIAVQADQSDEETKFLLDLAQDNSIIKGVVGWVDLQSPQLESKLEKFSSQPLLKGFRHVLQDEADDEFILRSDFIRGLELLSKFDFTYDILIFPKQLAAAKEAVSQLPKQAFVLDHIAKPAIGGKVTDTWKKGIHQLAQYENVSCKISGMVTEAKWDEWKYEDFIPYLDFVLEQFGADRLMYGSDWPVCTLSGKYHEVFGLVNQYISTLSSSEQASIMGENAVKFYKIN
ncbi:amidohydrolase family protein [Belliella kenyensis]|uniref:Amidohydrolase family protein n=1 Tax=Belliella kenyensis TaxID=1472724 RepID=A0ABV8ELF4_9BACT|nr:amidohydrolase family protein [Belliella kenyensis]MCH7401353.1 amidohydrolase family protein [Belliella kenyensis]MDN3602796.1 amidohydrolase family protein [Belliella kenyensis]